MDGAAIVSDKEKYLLKRRQEMEAELAKLNEAVQTGVDTLSSNDDLLAGLNEERAREDELRLEQQTV